MDCSFIGWIGQLFARAIQAAISRQREHLADASAVQFTRNPSGIAGALKKIAGYEGGSQITSPKASAFSHMFFASAINSLFATHPPLDERIRLLDPSFNPEIATLAAGTSGVPSAAAGFAGGSKPETIAVPREAISEATPVPSASRLEEATRFLELLPERLAVAVEEPFGASAVVHGLLIQDEPRARANQLAILKKQATPALVREIQRLLPDLEALPVLSRLPLATLATGALHRLSPAQYTDFCQTTEALIAADRQIDLFEFALQKSLHRHLKPHFDRTPPRIVRHLRVEDVENPCRVLLSCIAHVGAVDESAQTEAFEGAIRHLGFDPVRVTLLPVSKCNLGPVEEALEQLIVASPEVRHRVVEAASVAVAQDGVLHEREAELLRAVADALQCPMPPWVEWETPSR